MVVATGIIDAAAVVVAASVIVAVVIAAAAVVILPAAIVAEVQVLRLGNENTDAFPTRLSIGITGATVGAETLGAGVEATTNGETEVGSLMAAEEAVLLSMTAVLLEPEAGVNRSLTVDVDAALLTCAVEDALFVADVGMELLLKARAGGSEE